MTMTYLQAFSVIAAIISVGFSAASVTYALRYRRIVEKLRQPPVPTGVKIQGIELKCPNCDEPFRADIEIAGPFPPSADQPMPLGERLTRERAELATRLDALPADDEKREAYQRRIAVLDQQMRRFH